MISVSHDARTRELADRVLWIEDGELKELGHEAAAVKLGV